MVKALGWYERNAKQGVTPVDNTAMSLGSHPDRLQTGKGLHLPSGRVGRCLAGW